MIVLCVRVAEFYSEVDKKFGCMAFSLRSVALLMITNASVALVISVTL